MKKTVLFLLFATLLASCVDTPEMLTTEQEQQSATIGVPRYKMIQTENFHILLKWDTRTGSTWMVQYGLGDDTPKVERFIPHSDLIGEDDSWNGRFELYPTKNMFNFIMIDTFTGHTYRVQWSTNDEHCFAVPITGHTER